MHSVDLLMKKCSVTYPSMYATDNKVRDKLQENRYQNLKLNTALISQDVFIIQISVYSLQRNENQHFLMEQAGK